MRGHPLFCDHMKIGDINIDPPLVMAPMAGITSWPMRLLCRRMGASLTVSEMISSAAIVRGRLNAETLNSLKTNHEDRPLSIQVFGHIPEEVAEAARTLSVMEADMIDINMGCPVRKIVKNGSGSALMKDLDRAKKMIIETRKAVTIPLTVKMRTGWDAGSKNVIELAKICEGEGVDAITLHGRTRAMGFNGVPDFEIMAKVVESVSIPVIGNGGIMNGADAKNMFEKTGCAGLMPARGARGNPWIFAAITKGDDAPEANPTIKDKANMALEHLDLMLGYLHPKGAALEMRNHLSWYSKGIPLASNFRRKLHDLSSPDQIRELVDKYFIELE